ncbi:Integrase catalytic domain-containing protein [Abeliophyllum distichum]|uniref:Integrase catalytic domain-containing protein n=1 Tax=Abeliophyllum distichum TaxID=126358 RepID=A0ABD1UP90_9LAMI
MSVLLSSKSKEPTDVFDGTTDPIDHIFTFQDRVRLHGWPDNVACKAFPMTLKKDTREWFETLPLRSITLFADFVNKFAISFYSSARKNKIAMGLMVSFPHDDVLVITRDIADFDVKRVLVDMESAANVLSWDAFKALRISTNELKPVNTPLQGFGGATVIPEEIVDLPVVLEKHLACVSLVTLLVKTLMAYNAIYVHRSNVI